MAASSTDPSIGDLCNVAESSVRKNRNVLPATNPFYIDFTFAYEYGCDEPSANIPACAVELTTPVTQASFRVGGLTPPVDLAVEQIFWRRQLEIKYDAVRLILSFSSLLFI
jgi:hypothetical protein